MNIASLQLENVDFIKESNKFKIFLVKFTIFLRIFAIKIEYFLKISTSYLLIKKIKGNNKNHKFQSYKLVNFIN